MCFTGKNKNLAETPILKDFLIFVAIGQHFCISHLKMLVFNGDIKFS